MVRGADTIEGDIESAEGIGPPPPPPQSRPPEEQKTPGNQSPFTPDDPLPLTRWKPPNPRPLFNVSAIQLTEDDVREAFASYVFGLEGCCVNKGPVKKGQIIDIRPVMAVHYRLETFTEWRGTGWVTAPYYGGEVDGPENGVTPSGWDMEIYPDEPYTNHVKTAEMPHTATLARCEKCGGSGVETCRTCAGSGTTNCGTCNGRGLVQQRVRRGDTDVYEERKCGSCNNGRRTCTQCGGSGNNTCSNCSGQGQIKRFLQLFVKFKTSVKDFVHKDPSFPAELVQGVEGDLMSEEKGLDLKPLRDFPQPEINVASKSLIAEYSRERYHQDTQSERQLEQRHTIRGVPVTDVRYRYQAIPRHFYVYGRERRVYCHDYPPHPCSSATCCCVQKGGCRPCECPRRCVMSVVSCLVTVLTIAAITVGGVLGGSGQG